MCQSFRQEAVPISNMKLMLLRHRSTCNIKSTVCCWELLCSCSSALYHCPIQSDCSSECQGGGHVSYSGTHYSHGVGSICEGGYKVKVFTLYSCNIIAVHTTPSRCTAQQESYTSAAIEEWLNNPVQNSSLSDSAGVSHHFPRTGYTGVQNNSSCKKTRCVTV